MAENLTTESDEALALRAAAERSDEAFAELHRRYRRRIYLWCYRHVQDPEVALDLTQEIFIRIFRGIDGFAGRSRFSTWAYRIAQNHCLNARARELARWRQQEDVAQLQLEDRRAAQRLREAEASGDLDRLLAVAAQGMPADEIDAFVLHYRDGLSVAEITRMLGCTNATGARTLIQNARRKFRRLVERGETDDDRT